MADAKPKLRHLAINTDNILGEATFFMNAFDMEQAGRIDMPDGNPAAIYLTDGTVNLALINIQDPEYPNYMPRGLNHIGFVLSDLDQTIAKVEAAGGVATVDPNHRDAGDTWEMKMKSPAGVGLDLSPHGWPGVTL